MSLRSRSVALALLAAMPAVAALVVVAGRVGDTARFMTWHVVAFTALSGGVAVIAVLTGSPHPGQLAAGVLPGLAMSYVLFAAPFPLIAGVLCAAAATAVAVRGVTVGRRSDDRHGHGARRAA